MNEMIERVASIDYWIGIAAKLSADVARLAQEKIDLAAALVDAAGGRIEVPYLDTGPELELHHEKDFARGAIVYATRPKRRVPVIKYEGQE